ncbi:hypothetical protein Rsub_05883 [Raphidocelis subcapitata]|uniref:Chlorophyll a-b binding protein, chloroplastic n=1 Tax=Raphidocelis subcapitata TaxID=307507 RepID=A0A2V0P2N2_9CHLO|nr:hypothetical protein Rsub_05883 [Raphidocelis subcapitata]|eukprot:GBF93152.1 hypothetical protein Rsub_05883 [Raphidocelis subcapitata]
MLARAHPLAGRAAAAGRPRAAPALGPRGPRPGAACRAVPEDKDKQASQPPHLGGGGTPGGKVPSKDISDVSPPSSLRDVGAAVREAAPTYAPAFLAPPLVPTFSRRREIQAGRLAMIGMAAAMAWEIMLPSHPGPMAVTASLAGWSIPTVKLLFGGFVAHGLLGLLWPGSPTFDRANEMDYMRSHPQAIQLGPEGPPTKAYNPITEPSKFFGSSPHFGFTKKNELLHGRLAMLGFLAAVINENATGLGPIGQVAWWLGKAPPISPDWYSNAGLALAAFAAVTTGLAYAAGHAGTTQGEDDIY